ncbi:MAG TPA: hypothetical protein VKC89_01560 [Patescibacteria group bacterium]|nr:hypothetical protein [Patescibacteria group bacterium]
MSSESIGPNSEGKQPKVVKMPTAEIVSQKIQSTGLYGVVPQVDGFYDSLVKYTANRELVGMGLVMSWEMAGYDTLREYPEAMGFLVDMSFDKVIDAITPDAEVAQDAKEFRKKVEEEANVAAKATEPKPEQKQTQTSIDIKGLDKALVLATLYNGARPQGAGFLRYDPTPMTVEDATAVLEQSTDFDYLKGRVIKIDLSGDELDPRLYDRDNGVDTARKLIDSLREPEKPDPNNPTIRDHHLSEAGKQAQIARELLYEDPSGFERPGVFHMGLDDIADILDPKLRAAQEKIRKLKDQKKKK